MLHRISAHLYARRLRRKLAGATLPRHVAVVMDGNRRWARQMGFADPSVGHRYGAEHLEDLLQWCRGMGIGQVTAFVCSVDNLRKRDSDEVDNLMKMVETVITERLLRPGNPWRLRPAGRLDVLPDSTRIALKEAEERTRSCPLPLTIAIGYDGRAEIVDAVRSLLSTGVTVDDVTPEALAAHMYTAGLPDPDLIIRTSGEVRLSGFLLWQSASSELYFCDAYWPGFREVDFLRALRAYAARRTPA